MKDTFEVSSAPGVPEPQPLGESSQKKNLAYEEDLALEKEVQGIIEEFQKIKRSMVKKTYSKKKATISMMPKTSNV
jgi:hypothetical protein